MPKVLADQARRVTVVGTGVIGTSWAAHFLARGFEVVATDPAPGAAARLRESLDRLWPALERLGLAPDASRSRLRFADDLDESLRDTGFVQENTQENLEAKQRLIGDIDVATPAGVLIASSSSGLLPSDLQKLCRQDPGRVLIGHPFHPPHLMPLVEVVGGRLTDPGALERAMDFYRAAGKKPIRLRQELPGHVANRLQAALWREAFSLVERGAATVEDIDTAIMHGPGLRWAILGPFLTLHLTGGAGGMAGILDHLGPSVEAWWAQFTTPRLTSELKRAVSEDVVALAETMGGASVEARRDALLIELLALKAGRMNALAEGPDDAK